MVEPRVSLILEGFVTATIPSRQLEESSPPNKLSFALFPWLLSTLSRRLFSDEKPRERGHMLS